MKFNGKEYFAGMGDFHRYANPQFKVNDILEFPFSDEIPQLPGHKKITKGKYRITKVRPSMLGKGNIYELVRDRIGSKHVFSICTVAIEKAVDAGSIYRITC